MFDSSGRLLMKNCLNDFPLSSMPERRVREEMEEDWPSHRWISLGQLSSELSSPSDQLSNEHDRSRSRWSGRQVAVEEFSTGKLKEKRQRSFWKVLLRSSFFGAVASDLFSRRLLFQRANLSPSCFRLVWRLAVRRLLIRSLRCWPSSLLSEEKISS